VDKTIDLRRSVIRQISKPFGGSTIQVKQFKYFVSEENPEAWSSRVISIVVPHMRRISVIHSIKLIIVNEGK
jgi:hypothetical protein